MSEMLQVSSGGLTPALFSCAMACIGGALGLRCIIRARDATGASRLNWLLTAATSIGSGIWISSLIAVLGVTVKGTEIRYDVPLTLLSLLVTMVVVGLGLLMVGYIRSRTHALILGGLGTGLGVVTMHLLGTAALRLHGVMVRDPLMAVVSALIAVVGSVAALWVTVSTRGRRGAVAGPLVMGLAISGMNQAAIAATRINLKPQRAPLPGASDVGFVFPLVVVAGCTLLVLCAFVALSPTAVELAESELVDQLDGPLLPLGD
ncbi:MHYT domain-containing protein [Streptomyces sp. NPDC020801]|uniref:MHYT domain-containing protein n=1 Tax=unclassified Streptomyces TaxID=2593676 RepID=UPI00379BDC85